MCVCVGLDANQLPQFIHNEERRGDGGTRRGQEGWSMLEMVDVDRVAAPGSGSVVCLLSYTLLLMQLS